MAAQVTPTEVLVANLVTAALVTRPASNGSWPATIGSMPDSIDNRVTLYDLSPETQGKLHTGETVNRWMVQIRVRAIDYRDGWTKLNAILEHLSALSNAAVVVNGSVNVTLHGVTIVQPGSYIGQDEKNRRTLFTAVVKTSHKEN